MARVLDHLTPRQTQGVADALRVLIGAAAASRGPDADGQSRGRWPTRSKVLL